MQARIRVKNRKRKADEASCPVCNERLSGTPEELNQHVDRCLNKQNNGNPAGQNANLDEEEVDVEGDAETFEEYEWAGQRRVRASSMLVGGFSGKFTFIAFNYANLLYAQRRICTLNLRLLSTYNVHFIYLNYFLFMYLNQYRTLNA